MRLRLRLRLGLRRALSYVLLAVIIISEWLHWEVEKGMIRWEIRYKPFPSPFYLFSPPRWFWEDLAITLAVFASIVLAILAGGDAKECQ